MKKAVKKDNEKIFRSNTKVSHLACQLRLHAAPAFSNAREQQVLRLTTSMWSPSAPPRATSHHGSDPSSPAVGSDPQPHGGRHAQAGKAKINS